MADLKYLKTGYNEFFNMLSNSKEYLENMHFNKQRKNILCVVKKLFLSLILLFPMLIFRIQENKYSELFLTALYLITAFSFYISNFYYKSQSLFILSNYLIYFLPQTIFYFFFINVDSIESNYITHRMMSIILKNILFLNLNIYSLVNILNMINDLIWYLYIYKYNGINVINEIIFCFYIYIMIFITKNNISSILKKISSKQGELDNILEYYNKIINRALNYFFIVISDQEPVFLNRTLEQFLLSNIQIIEDQATKLDIKVTESSENSESIKNSFSTNNFKDLTKTFFTLLKSIDEQKSFSQVIEEISSKKEKFHQGEYSFNNCNYFEIYINELPNIFLKPNCNHKIYEIEIYNITKTKAGEIQIKKDSEDRQLFLSRVAHEFKTPLYGIVSLCKKILENEKKEATILSDLEELDEVISRKNTKIKMKSKNSFGQRMFSIKENIETGKIVKMQENETKLNYFKNQQSLKNLDISSYQNDNQKSHTISSSDDSSFQENDKNKFLNKKLSNQVNLINKYSKKKVINHQDELKSIENLSNYVIFLVVDFIQASKGNELKIEMDEVSLKKILIFCFEVLKTLLYVNQKETITCEMKIDPALSSLKISTDEIRLKQILLNLVSNSVKFTKFGKITLEACHNKEKNEILISVEDTGCGMNCNQVDKVSNKKFDELKIDTKVNKLGSGLGLSITSSIAEKLGMEFTIISNQNTGTKACIKLKLDKSISENSHNMLKYSSNNITIIKTSPYKSKKSLNPIVGSIFKKKNSLVNSESNDISIISNKSSNVNFNKTYSNELNEKRKKEQSKFISNKLLIQDNLKDYDLEDLEEEKKSNADTFNLVSNNSKTNNINIINNNLIKFSFKDGADIKQISNTEDIILNKLKSKSKQIDVSFHSTSSEDSSSDASNLESDRYQSDETKKLNIKKWSKQVKKGFNFSIKLPNTTKLANKKETGFSFSPLPKKNSRVTFDFDNSIKVPINQNKSKSKKSIIYSTINEENMRTAEETVSKENFIILKDSASETLKKQNNKVLAKNDTCKDVRLYPNKFQTSLFLTKKNVICIIEDSPLLKENLKKQVAKMLYKNNLDYEIKLGNDGVDLLKYIIDDQLNGNLIKLVISDENMEYMNGSEVLHIIKKYSELGKLKKSPNFICCTAFDDLSTVSYLKEIGFIEVIEKNTNLLKLERIILPFILPLLDREN